MSYNRRTFIKGMAAATAAIPFSGIYASEVAEISKKKYPIAFFTKPLDNYDFKKGISESLQEIKKRLELLAQLNKVVGIQGGYQNHSGIRVGAPMWDVWELIQNFPPQLISSQFDVRHSVTEGNSSWIIALRLLSKNIGSLAIKDFTWQVANRKAQIVSVPLGEGIVNFDLFFSTIKELKIEAPISLHVEYPILSAEEEKLTLLQKQNIIASKLKKDVDFIRFNLIKFKLI